jgi:hypothetical protein
MTKIQLVAACAAAIGAPIVALGLGTSTASADPGPIHDAVHQVIGDVHQVRVDVHQVRADVHNVVRESFKAIPHQPPNLKPLQQAVTVKVQDSVKTVNDTVNVAHTTVKTVIDHVAGALTPKK